MLNRNQISVNEDFFSKVARMGSIYIWPDKGLSFEIRDGKFVCDTKEKKLAFINNVSFQWMRNNLIY